MKKLITLRIPEDLYDDVKKAAYVRRTTVTSIVISELTRYVSIHQDDISEYDNIIKNNESNN